MRRLARMRSSYGCHFASATMEEPLAIRRQWRLMHVVTPPRGLWTHLVKSPQSIVRDANMGFAFRERKRKWELICNPCGSYRFHGSECVFCIVHNVWPRCYERRPKRTKTSPNTSPSSWQTLPDGNGTHEAKCNDKV